MRHCITGILCLSLAGCLAGVRDAQVEHLNATTQVAGALIKLKALKPGDRVLLVGYGEQSHDKEFREYEDEFIVALVKQGVAPIRLTDIHLPSEVFEKPSDMTSKAVNSKQGVNVFLSEETQLTHLRRFRKTAEFSRIVAFRWLYSREGRETQDRLYVRVVDAETGFVSWSDLIIVE